MGQPIISLPDDQISAFYFIIKVKNKLNKKCLGQNAICKETSNLSNQGDAVVYKAQYLHSKSIVEAQSSRKWKN